MRYPEPPVAQARRNSMDEADTRFRYVGLLLAITSTLAIGQFATSGYLFDSNADAAVPRHELRYNKEGTLPPWPAAWIPLESAPRMRLRTSMLTMVSSSRASMKPARGTGSKAMGFRICAALCGGQGSLRVRKRSHTMKHLIDFGSGRRGSCQFWSVCVRASDSSNAFGCTECFDRVSYCNIGQISRKSLMTI